MKNLIIGFLFLGFVSSNLVAQDFGALGTKWVFSHQIGGSYYPIEYQSIKDTLILGKTNHSILINDRGFLDTFFLYQSSDTVYIYHEYQNKFCRYFVFNQNQGDTLVLEATPRHSTSLSTYRLFIDSVFFVNIDGQQLKKYKLIPIDGVTQFPSGILGEYAIDKIGLTHYFFSRTGFTLGNTYGPLRCYKDSLIDTNFTVNDCYYTERVSLNENSLNSQIHLYPNPAHNVMQINSSELKLISAKLFNVLGKEISINVEKNHQINVSNLPKGIYFLRVKTNEGTVVKKWIKE